ncbi:MAG: AsnC family protein [Streptosporangiaceae bacterium]
MRVGIGSTLKPPVVQRAAVGAHEAEPFNLDDTDRRLLALLSEDPRADCADLAKRVGLSDAAPGPVSSPPAGSRRRSPG